MIKVVKVPNRRKLRKLREVAELQRYIDKREQKEEDTTQHSQFHDNTLKRIVTIGAISGTRIG